MLKVRIIGLSDGLTVPFALTAGLSSIGSARLVVTAGLAELLAGSISMGLGGYCESRSGSQDQDLAEARMSLALTEDSGFASGIGSLPLPIPGDARQGPAIMFEPDGSRSTCDLETIRNQRDTEQLTGGTDGARSDRPIGSSGAQ